MTGISFRVWMLVPVVTFFMSMPGYNFFVRDIKASGIDTQQSCQELIDELTGKPDWYTRLVDPVLTSKDEINEIVLYYEKVDECLKTDPDLLPDQVDSIRQYILTFLTFADFNKSSGNHKLELVDLATSNDPAVRKLRDDVGLQPPEGLIFFHTYPSIDAMPDMIKRGFANRNVAGITMFSRYIAVLEDINQSLPETLLQSRTLPKTVSHELVHAYINSILGVERYLQTPKWWDEGIAIYFSGSGKEHTVVTPNLTVTSTSPEEYRQYQLIFEYLENQHGRKKLLELIRQSVTEANPGILYKSLDISNEVTLFSEAAQWKRQVIITRGILILILAGVIFWRLYRRLPEFRCPYCGHAGKKAEFSTGYCPNCFNIIE